MDLVERYLAAIGRALPDKSRKDITAELRDVLYSQVEEREAELGRPLDRAEQERLVTDFGHPLVVAGRYRTVQHLIGPEIFPFWWATLKVVLAIVAAVYVVGIVVSVVGLGDLRLPHRVGDGLVGTLIWAFGVVTLVFVGLEHWGRGAATLARWRPRQLPPANAKPRSSFETAVEIGMQLVFILWWVGVVHFRDVVPGYPAGIDLAMAPVWTTWFWPILAYVSAETVVNLIALVRPAWGRTNAILAVVRGVVGALLLVGILQAGHFVEVGGAALDEAAQAVIQRNIDLGFRIGLVATIACLLAKAAFDAWRLLRTGDLFAGAELKTGRASGSRP